MRSFMARRLRRLADNQRPGQAASRYRQGRFALFASLLAGIPAPPERRLRILDVGGTADYWEQMAPGADAVYEIVLLNLHPQPVVNARIRSVLGNASDLSMFVDREFDVVHSNAVIEHLPHLELQQRMAAEVCRVAPRFWVQTPNRWFPLESHYLFPYFMSLPLPVRVALHRRMDLGWISREPDATLATAHVQALRLLTRRDLQRLFPQAEIVTERAFGMAKSFIAVGGWWSPVPRLVSRAT